MQEAAVRLVTLTEFEDFIARPENADRLFELINGEIVEKVPTEEHSIAASNVYDPLRDFVKARNLGRVLFEVRRRVPGDEHNARLPDVEYTSTSRLLPVTRKGAVPQMPDLAVEIKSPNETIKSLREKAAYYLANGVQMVWVVYPKTRVVEIYHANGDIEMLSEGDTITAEALLPGFALPVKEIFKDLD